MVKLPLRSATMKWLRFGLGQRALDVSVDGTQLGLLSHLGHNLLDWKVNRYCINLVSVLRSLHCLSRRLSTSQDWLMK